MDRRRALIRLGAGSASLFLFGRRPLLRAAQEPEPGPMGSRGPAALADLFRETPRDRILDAGARAAREGHGAASILAGAFLAGIHDVRPRHVGGKLHCVMMVESVHQLCAALDPEEQQVLALWALDDFKRSQARDEQEGGWVLPPAPKAAFPGEAAARKELLAAMEAADDQRADRAITGLVQWHSIESLFEILWPLCARSFVDIGHKIIFGAQIERVLRRLPWSEAEPPLRSLVYGLLHRESSDPLASVFERSRRLAPGLPPGWLQGKDDPDASLGLMRRIRGATSEEAQQAVIEAFKAGAGPAAVWDGIRLAAAEIHLRRPDAPPQTGRGLLPVHAVTTTEAFGHAFTTTQSDATRRLIILQAAGWLPDMREALVERRCHRKDGPELDSLGLGREGKAPTLEEVLDRRDPALARAALEADPLLAEPYRSALRRGLAAGGVEHHQHKFAAAVMLESHRVHPRWAPAILASAVSYLPTSPTPETDVARRSREAILRARG